MTARRAYPMIYRRIMHGLDEDGQLRIDAILGDPEAVRVRNERQLELITLAGVEIG